MIHDGLKVELALGYGTISASDAAQKLEIETYTAGTSSAEPGDASIETSWSGSWIVIEADPGGKIETGGLVSDEAVSDADWTDITQYVSEMSIRHNKPSRWQSFDARTLALTLTDDEVRRWDPLNLSGPYVASGATQLREGVRIRVSLVQNTVTYWLFTGFVTGWPVSLSTWPANDVRIEASDWFSLLGRGGRATGSAVGASETVTARIGRILDAASVPVTERDLDTSTIACSSMTYNQPYLALAKLAVASEGGELWVAPDGRITFRSRVGLYGGDRWNLTQWTFTNVPTGTSVTECDYEAEPVVANTLIDLSSRVVLKSTTGTEQEAVDTGLLALYGDRLWSRSDLMTNADADVLNLASFLVAAQPTLPVRIESLTIRPDIHAEAVNAMLTLQMLDRVRVSHQQISGGTITRDATVVGVEHRITDVTWAVTYALQDCTDLASFTIESSAMAGTDMVV